MQELQGDVTVSDCSSQYMTIYGLDNARTKLPSNIDGLKLSHRRILKTLHDKPDTQKEQTLVGRVMEIHPHGDQSIADAISLMAQPFTHQVPLVFSKSNTGTYKGNAPAAARYVDVSESEIIKDLLFGDINLGMLKMVPCETERGVEPAYFIPKLPTALLFPCFAIVLGFQSMSVGTSIDDLCKLTKEYIRLREEDPVNWRNKLPGLVKYLFPNYATQCILRNSKQLLKEYKKGNFDYPILIDGTMKIKSDRIIIETLPPIPPSYKDSTMKVGQNTIIKTSWEYQNFQQMVDFSGKPQGVMKAAFTCVVRRGMNPFDLLATLKRKLMFTRSWSPDRRYVGQNNKMVIETPYTLLDKWYQTRRAAVLGDLKQKLNQLVERYRQLLALIIIVDHTDEVVNIFKNAKDDETPIRELCERFKDRGLTHRQAQFLGGLKLTQLTAKGKAELEADLAKIKEDMKKHQEKFHQISQIMIKHIESFEKKYDDEKMMKQENYSFRRACTIPKYIGYACYRGNGFIMLEKEDEMDEVLRDFDPEQIEFELFPKTGEVVAVGADEDVVGDVPKYIKASYVTKTTNDKYTACVVEGGGALVLEGVTPKLDHMVQAVPIGTKFTAITKSGHRQIVTVDDKVIRKSATSGPTMRDVVYVSPVVDDDVFVVHASDAQQNFLTIERVTGEVKLKKLVVGKWAVLAIFPATEDKVIINIPKDQRNRCNTRHVVLEKMAEKMPPNSKAGLLYGRGTNKSDFALVPWKRRSSIQTIK